MTNSTRPTDPVDPRYLQSMINALMARPDANPNLSIVNDPYAGMTPRADPYGDLGGAQSQNWGGMWQGMGSDMQMPSDAIRAQWRNYNQRQGGQ